MPIYKKVKKTFFKTWTPEMSYVLGFFAADGNLIRTKRGTHFIAFHSADRSLIEIVRKSIGSDHMISRRVSDAGAWYRLQIGSVEMFNDLEKLGLHPNKSKRMSMPEVPQRFFSDFVRGYFDGDGNVWSGVAHAGTSHPLPIIRAAFTSASRNFLLDLHTELKVQGLVGGSLFRVRGKECYRLQFASADALKLYKIMYNDPRKPYLSRKKLVFEKFAHAAVAQR